MMLHHKLSMGHSWWDIRIYELKTEHECGLTELAKSGV